MPQFVFLFFFLPLFQVCNTLTTVTTTKTRTPTGTAGWTNWKRKERADEHSSTVRLYGIKNGDFNIIMYVINVALYAHRVFNLLWKNFTISVVPIPSPCLYSEQFRVLLQTQLKQTADRFPVCHYCWNRPRRWTFKQSYSDHKRQQQEQTKMLITKSSKTRS